ncbi:MAG: DUF4194 domain-containing protein [Legionella sp.]|uniref:DUF4194 domain-containing protein n=1 Tax=Legionella sp. TaxID=459 RepID=UPI0039E3ED62
MSEIKEHGNTLSLILIKLMKGVFYLDDDPALWQHLLHSQAQVRDYVHLIGLDLSLLEDEGIAWLNTRHTEHGTIELPSLVNKRQLSYPVSLLLALFRRKLVEHDAMSGEQRLILEKEEIVEQLRLFLPRGSNEARMIDQVDTYINKIVELGFVRRLQNDANKIEVKRIIKAFIDAQWLHDFEERLKAYAVYAGLNPAED